VAAAAAAAAAAALTGPGGCGRDSSVFHGLWLAAASIDGSF
jgi:hypothetical protein